MPRTFLPSLVALCVCFSAAALALFLFTSLEALPIFHEERAIYTREHSRGAYRVLSYSLTNFLVYIPVCAVMSVVFTCISYFMIALPADGLWFQILAIFFVLLEGNAFATCVSAFAPDPLTVRGLDSPVPGPRRGLPIMHRDWSFCW